MFVAFTGLDDKMENIVPVPIKKFIPVDSDISDYVKSVLGDYFGNNINWLNTDNSREIEPPLNGSYGIGNLQRINDIQHINKFLATANNQLNNGQFLIINLETKDARAQRVLHKYPKPFNLLYYGIDFVLNRVFPKLGLTKKLYSSVKRGKNQVISLTEGLARLVSCGFEIVDYKKLGQRTYVIAKKNNEPYYDENASNGLLIKLKRVGYGGKVINVYKMRTMHPFSEYLQDYMYELNDLEEGGKIKNDFRTTEWGKFFRKYWIDEIPMLINFFKGEMKLVGVRPLSQQYFNLYPDDLRDLRTRIKPGLIPPFYADMPTSIEEIQESERTYLNAYDKKPIRTDILYFFKVFYNIIFQGARSR